MAAAGLPEDGDLRLGRVRLPAGRRVQAGFGPTRRPVAGFADFSVLAGRPPGNRQHAQQLAAEQWAFCDEVGRGLSDIDRISAYILESPVWRFWWD